MTYQYTEDEYAQAITREMGKRATTYPKIIAKKYKQSMPVHEIAQLELIMDCQNLALAGVKNILDYGAPSIEISMDWLLEELIREYRERKRCYPRWVGFYKMMTAEAAAYELAVWEELCIWFADAFMFDSQIAITALEPKRKKRAQV